MKVFISWSGEKSRQVALLLEEWIKCVIQASEPWMSTNIERGALWFSEINEQLASVSLGIICITAENKDKPWILFEAGALAKGLQTNRVCTLLIDLKNEDIEQPLAQFNHTSPDRDGIFQLINTINTQLSDKKLPQNILDKVFDKHWPDFDLRFKEIAKMQVPAKSKTSKRDSEDILIELLNTVRSFDRRLQNLEANNLTKDQILLDDTRHEPRPSQSNRITYETYKVHDLIREYKKTGLNKEGIFNRLVLSHKPIFSKRTLEKMIEDIWEENS